MEWWEVQLDCTASTADTVASVLQELPEVQGVLYEGYVADGPLHPEYGEWFAQGLSQNAGDGVSLKIYLPGWLTRDEVRAKLADRLILLVSLGVPENTVTPQFKRLDESSWAQVWEVEFQPIPIGQNLIIAPTNLRDRFVETDRHPIFLDPGRAFGTGSHPTTQLCLELLEPRITSAAKVLDVGCGTGVLSIAAVKLGAGEVTAVDIDPVAVQVTSENATANGVEEEIHISQSDLLASVATTTYDVVMANILRDVVILLSGAVADRMTPEGVFIASGFLEKDVETVSDALNLSGLHVDTVAVKDEWAAILAVRQR